jgi:hypothetical protein
VTLFAGSVGLNSDESASGSGLALALYTADAATRSLPTLPTLGSTAAPFRPERPVNADDVAQIETARFAALGEACRLANAYAGAIIGYLTAHSTVIVTVTGGGLQRTPNPNNPSTATLAPATAVTLNGGIS